MRKCPKYIQKYKSWLGLRWCRVDQTFAQRSPEGSGPKAAGCLKRTPLLGRGGSGSEVPKNMLCPKKMVFKKFPRPINMILQEGGGGRNLGWLGGCWLASCLLPGPPPPRSPFFKQTSGVNIKQQPWQSPRSWKGAPEGSPGRTLSAGGCCPGQASF